MGALCALPADSAAPGSLPALGCRLEPILSVKWAQGGLSREQGAWLRGAVGATHPPAPMLEPSVTTFKQLRCGHSETPGATFLMSSDPRIPGPGAPARSGAAGVSG